MAGESMRRIGSIALVGWLAWADPVQADGPANTAQVSALVRRAEAQQAQGRYADSVKTLAEAEAAAGEKAAPADLAAIHGAIGNAYVALGPPSAAREHLTRALELARAAAADPLAAALLTNLGNL